MSLSRPVMNLLGVYFEQSHYHPMRTKSITSGIVAALGSLTSQQLTNAKYINYDSVIAFGLFGLLFGGTLPAAFDRLVGQFMVIKGINRGINNFLVERLLYTPLHVLIALYSLPRLQGRDTEDGIHNIKELYWRILKGNWKWFTILYFVIYKYTPPMLQGFIFNIAEYVWFLYLASELNKNRKKTAGKRNN